MNKKNLSSSSSSSSAQEIKTVINLVQKPKQKKKVKKVVEAKNYYLCYKLTSTQENFHILAFSTKEQAEITKKTWDKNKNRLCILVSTNDMNEFILSKK